MRRILNFSSVLFGSCLAIVLAMVSAEGMLWVIKPTGLDFESQFRPHPYVMDDYLGLIFGYPNYVGHMRPQNSDLSVPLALNELRVRPAVRSSGPGPYKHVMFIGGSSQTFGFGLALEDTVPSRTAYYACEPSIVHNLALPGTLPWTDYAIYEQDPQKNYKPDTIVLSLYAVTQWAGAARIAKPTQKLPVSTLQIVHQGWYYTKQWYHVPPIEQSALLNLLMTSKTTERLIRLFELAKSWAAEDVKLPSTEPAWYKFTGEKDFLSYMDFLRKENPQATILISLMPSSFTKQDFWADLKKIAPPFVRIVDLQLETFGQKIAMELLPDSHWGPKLADYLGRRIAETLCDK